MTDDPDVRFAGSIMDYLFRRLALEYMTYDERAELGIFSVEERTQTSMPRFCACSRSHSPEVSLPPIQRKLVSPSR